MISATSREREAAYTKAGHSFPGFVSAKRLLSGRVRLTLRGDPDPKAAELGMVAGLQTCMELDAAEWLAFLQAAIGI